MASTTGDVSVSSVTTVFNGERYLVDALGTLRAQTLEDLQIVVVIDGSTDASDAIARDQAAQDPRVEVITMPRIGRSAALNVGLAAARAPYVAILDADDLAHPRRLEIQRDRLSTQPEEVGAVGTAAVDFRGPSGQLPTITTEPPWPIEDVTSELRRHNPLRHSSVMLRRSALDAVGGYDTARRRQVDYDLLVRIAARGLRLQRIELPLCGIRTHDEQSYLAGKQLRYRISSLGVQARALREVPGDRSDLAWFPVRAGYFLARTVAPRLFAGRSGATARYVTLRDRQT